MSFTKHKEYILEAIDHLRARKSRPDCSRICKYLQKLYKVSPNEAKSSLRLCLMEKLVLKVEYKNNVSYRNAAKWKTEHKKSIKSSDSESKFDMSSIPAKDENRIIVSALATLIYQNENYLEKGVPLEELIKIATAQSPKYSRKQLESIINKGIASGTLVSLYNGNLALGAGDHDADSVDSVRSDYNTVPSMKRTRGRPRKGTVPFSVKTKAPSAGVRVGERRKMAKKVFDPSDNNVPIKRKRGRPLGSTNKNTEHNRKHKASSIAKSDNTDTTGGSQNSDENSVEEEQEENYGETSGGVCSVCLMQKSRGSDKLVECRDCSNKAHYSCLQSGSGMLKLRPDSTWQCPHCKTCVVCCETNDAGVLTVCSLCSDAYHALCHSPRIPERLKAWDHWECNNCLESRPTVRSPSLAPSNSITSSSFPIEAFLKPHEIDMSKSRKTNVPVDPSIPDISNWSTEDVYEYFKEHMPEAAPALKDQDFDGQALKVARRKDIVTGLGLPLGRALKTYRIVVKLQTRKDDFTMCWG